MLGDRLDGVGDVADQVRVPEVETDARRLAVELVVEDRDERRRVGEPVRDDFDRDADAERLGGRQISSRLRSAAPR